MSDSVFRLPVSPLTKVVDGETIRLVLENKIEFSDGLTPRVPFDGKTCPNCGWDISAHPAAPRERPEHGTEETTK
jgi:hypothetical protein